MQFWYQTWLNVFLCSLAVADNSDLWLSRSEQLTEEGKKQYEMIQEKLPRYGDCWRDAVEMLHSGCKQLTEDVQSRLALAFADCFLKKAGRRGCPCSQVTPVKDCLRDVDVSTFASYTEFFTHTQNICFYLQSQAWQEKTDNTILRLTTSSDRVSYQLQEASKRQGEILKLQEKSADAQHLLLENGATLNFELEQSRLGVREAFEEFRASTGEQRLLIGEIFDGVSGLRTLLLSEFTGLYSYVLYVLAVVVAFLLTSTPRTSAARFWLLGVWTLDVVVERFLVNYQGRGDLFDDNNTILYQRLWMCRKLSCAVAVCLLGWFSFRYQDYNILNNRLLTEIHRQNDDLKSWLQLSGQVAKTNGTLGVFSENDSRKRFDDSDDSTYDSTFVCSSSDSSDEDSWASLDPRDSRSCTPVRDLLEIIVPQRIKDAVAVSSPVKNSACNGTPNLKLDSVPRYNLRDRGKFKRANPLVHEESPGTFENVVKKLARTNRRNGRRVRAALGNHDVKYSSDEE